MDGQPHLLSLLTLLCTLFSFVKHTPWVLRDNLTNVKNFIYPVGSFVGFGVVNTSGGVFSDLHLYTVTLSLTLVLSSYDPPLLLGTVLTIVP